MNSQLSHHTSLFENATEGIILTNGEGKIILVNPAAERIFNYTRDEIVGRPVEVLIPMRFQHNHSAMREGFYHNPQNRSMGHGRNLFGKRKDGSEIPVEVSLSFYKQEEELFVIAFIVDITERKQIEENMLRQQKELEAMAENMRKLNAELETKVEERTMILQEALNELEASQKDLNDALSKEKDLNEIKSRFVSIASHEFRTPLSTVLSSAALVSKYTQTEDQDKRDKHVKRIKDAVKHLNDLLEDFLSLGKLEEGKIFVNPEKFLLKDFLEETAEEIQAIVKPQQSIHIECDNLTWVTDRKLLKNIMLNLLSNAVKFSPEGAAVIIQAQHEHNNLIVAVKDGGIGIAEEDIQHLFSSFFRAKNAVNIQGTGLGLNIVKKYTELLQGQVTLQSAIGKGTTVTIILPELTNTEA
ncbi:MAG: PAS domain-containing sensor histidine kinase [Ferruginibacter sp.]